MPPTLPPVECFPVVVITWPLRSVTRVVPPGPELADTAVVGVFRVVSPGPLVVVAPASTRPALLDFLLLWLATATTPTVSVTMARATPPATTLFWAIQPTQPRDGFPPETDTGITF